MRFVIDGKTYQISEDLTWEQRLTTWDIYELETELADLHIDMLFEDFEALGRSLENKPRDPRRLLMQTWLIWAVRRSAGEHASFRECGECRSFEVVADPQDHKEKKGPDPQGARPDSGRAAKPHKQAALKVAQQSA